MSPQNIVRTSVLGAAGCVAMISVGLSSKPANAAVTSSLLAVSQAPGPSAALFAAPPYTCSRNYFVSPSGRDSNPGTSAYPWATLQGADNTRPSAGACINVEPGTYTGATINYGGSFAGPGGYVVYRCTQLDACVVKDWNGFNINASGSTSYVMIDGFDMEASAAVSYGIGVAVRGSNARGNVVHHVWALNNIIHGFGQSGIDVDSTDYVYWVHNLAYGNSHVTCDAQGSGITTVVPKAVANYVPTADDLTFGPYHIVVAWNIAHDNVLTQCGSAQNPYDTDGNGINFDDFANQGQSPQIAFPYQTLVVGNVSYNNGGAGIYASRSSNVTIVNNTAWSNYQDPFNNGTGRGEISVLGSANTSVVGNIAYTETAVVASDPRCKGVNYSVSPWNLPSACPLQWNAAFIGGDAFGVTSSNDVWSNNISFGGTPPYVNTQGNAMWNETSINCSGTGNNQNLCNKNPGLDAIRQANFGLKSSSPAINYAASQHFFSFMGPDTGACARALITCGKK